jgi:lipopolysaccharide export system protein LptA
MKTLSTILLLLISVCFQSLAQNSLLQKSKAPTISSTSQAQSQDGKIKIYKENASVILQDGAKLEAEVIEVDKATQTLTARTDAETDQRKPSQKPTIIKEGQKITGQFITYSYKTGNYQVKQPEGKVD